MTNYRAYIREAIKSPVDGTSPREFGKWAILNAEQRKLIGRLLDEMDSADAYIKKLYEENQQLKEINEEHKKLNGELREENKKYKETIEKVKKMIIDNIEETTYEYIGSNKIKVLLELRMDNDGVNKLLDILKDVE